MTIKGLGTCVTYIVKGPPESMKVQTGVDSPAVGHMTPTAMKQIMRSAKPENKFIPPSRRLARRRTLNAESHRGLAQNKALSDDPMFRGHVLRMREGRLSVDPRSRRLPIARQVKILKKRIERGTRW